MAVFASESGDSSLLASTFGNAKMTTSTVAFILTVVVLTCLITRIRTGFQNKRQSASNPEPKEIAVLPYWIPWFGHAIPFLTRFQSFLADASKSTKDGVFHLILAGSVHNIAISPSVVKQILLQKSTILSSNALVIRLVENFFGNEGSLRKADPAFIFGTAHQVLFKLNREPFVSNAAANTVRVAQERIYNLVSFSHSWVDQSIWERVANITIDPSGTSAVASFFPLIRYFVGDLACGILTGQDFMTNNPNFLLDLFTLDAAFNKLLVGLPWWFPGMAPVYAARSRLIQAVREHQEALYAVWEDRDPGSGWSDMSDVSNVMLERAKVWRSVRAEPDLFSTSDLAVVWTMNVNANQIVFWALWYIYQDPTLCSEIRAEIAPYATLSSVHSDLPTKEPPKLTINLDALLHKCPLLKATYFETLRLEAQSTSYKAVLESFTVNESAEDAALDGKSQPQTYKFKKGSYICIPHGVHQMDDRYWKDPKRFIPRRFFVSVDEYIDKKDENDDDDEKEGLSAEKTAVDMGTMKVFGGGLSMCKGRNFAEREVLTFMAAVLTSWDVEPADGTGRWTDPGRVWGSGAFVPRRDVRVRMSRREV